MRRGRPAGTADGTAQNDLLVRRLRLFESSLCALSSAAMAFSVNSMREDQMRRAFDLFDRDGDGKISQQELGDVLKTLNRSATEADIKELIGGSVSGMFTARGGSIDFETFKQMLVRATPHLVPTTASHA